MELTQAQIAEGLRRAAEAMPRLEQQLNAADAQLGDGDTGSMLARVIAGMESADPGSAASASEAFARLARAAMSATGSSLGTLLAGAMLTLSKETKAAPPLWSDLPGLIEAARAGMMARGGAAPGDKTVLDALEALASGTAGTASAATFAPAAVTATRAALEAFRDQPCRMGRAKFYADKSRGLDDPGMVAVAELAEVMAGAAARQA